MIPPWAYFDEQDRETLRALVAFLNTRLENQETIDWAIELKPKQRIERMAIEVLLNGPGARELSEPWSSAWRLIQEYWAAPQLGGRNGTAIYAIQKRLQGGDRSGAAVTLIVDLVAPRLKVEPIDAWRWSYMKKPRRPKAVEHVLSARLTSGDLFDLDMLELETINDIAFLKSLANSLEAAVNHGLDIALRLGWTDAGSFTALGFLNRVYYKQPEARDGKDNEPDSFHHGIAPSVKLLHAVVTRLADIQPLAAQIFVRRWEVNASSVFVRLWAAMARSSQFVASDNVALFFQSLDNRRFWNLHSFPEIAELRAVRFGEFDASFQKQMATRLQKGPPRNYWPKEADHSKVIKARQYWAARELRRIEITGSALPPAARMWLDAQCLQFADLAQMTIGEGFPEGTTAGFVPPNPDSRYNHLQGVTRLEELETALASSRSSWDVNPAEGANDWINQLGNAENILTDFEVTNNGGDNFPKVWNRFGSAHRPPQQDSEAAQVANLAGVAGRVLNLLSQLSDATLSSAIEGICSWLDSWEDQVVKMPLALPVWLRLWPLAVDVTNQRPENVEDEDLSVTARTVGDDREPMDLDTLNTPAGKLVGVFLAACPSLPRGTQAFLVASVERQMRDIVIAADGRSGLIAKHRMIEALPYFLRADRDWAQGHLVAPLRKDDAAAFALWRAVARRTHFAEVLETIGAEMTERANDRRLGRDTRRRLVFSLVIESLHAFRERRKPAIPYGRVQQMLRTLDDEVRASAANAIQIYVRDLSAKPPADQFSKTPSEIFRAAAAPFISEVWPQEQSLTTPGVSAAFADLPATSGEAFAEAVDRIARFLVPFECWSMVDYGLYGDEGEGKKLAIINDEAKAVALLKLLDLTVGTSEGSVVPHDLADALDQISMADPGLATTATFRRLATAARR